MKGKAETLRIKKEIQELFKTGKRVKRDRLHLVFKPNRGQGCRYVFCADRTARKAHERNRIKRVLRALVTEPGCNVDSSFDIALIAGLEFTRLEYSQRVNILAGLMSKLKP